jgi:large subunit ribosomal protein L21
MYWVIELNKKQYMIEPGSKSLLVDRIDVQKDTEINIDRVLLFKNDKDEVTVGAPYVKGLSLKAKVLGDVSGKKIRIFKYKRRKDYRRTIGTRPQFTRILVQK